MAHDVQFSIPQRSLGKADVEFKVHGNNGLIGTLRVSKGSVVWFPKDTSNGHKASWVQFDRIMKKGASGVESR